MSSKPLQTDDSSETRPSAALNFVAKKNTRSAIEGKPSRPKTVAPKAIDSPAVDSPKLNTNAASSTSLKSEKKSKPPGQDDKNERHVYEPFSNQLRRDLKRRLKRLSSYREDQGHKVSSVKQFLEEAVIQWLAGQEEPLPR